MVQSNEGKVGLIQAVVQGSRLAVLSSPGEEVVPLKSENMEPRRSWVTWSAVLKSQSSAILMTSTQVAAMSIDIIAVSQHMEFYMWSMDFNGRNLRSGQIHDQSQKGEMTVVISISSFNP